MPRSPYTISITTDPAYRDRIRTRMLANLIRRALASERFLPTTVTVVITNDATVRRLNRRFRGQDQPTDVLSFNLDGDELFVTRARTSHFGEIVLSYPTARRQARAAGHPVDEELAHLVVHGVLHLLGYDHERVREERVMRAREDALLGRKVH